MRRLLTAVLDFMFTRYYIVEYDADEAMDLGFSPARPPLSPFQCSGGAEEFGALDNGVFVSYKDAMRYAVAFRLYHYHHAPLLPEHITRIPRNHPLVR